MVAVTALIHSSVKYTQLARRLCRVHTLLLGQECIAILQQLRKFSFKAAVQKQNRHCNIIFIHANTWRAAGIQTSKT